MKRKSRKANDISVNPKCDVPINPAKPTNWSSSGREDSTVLSYSGEAHRLTQTLLMALKNHQRKKHLDYWKDIARLPQDSYRLQN